VERVLKQPKIPTMGKKLIVEASTPGHFPGLLWERFGVKDMPPWTADDQASAIIECIKAGAAAIHTHPRDPKAKYNYEIHSGRDMAPELTALVLDKVYAKKLDFVPLAHCWHPKGWVGMAEADFITPTKELLDYAKGNKYIQGNVMPTWIYPRCREGLISSWFTANSLKEGITYCENNSVKPLIALEIERLVWFKETVIDAGVFKTPPHLNLQEGKHGLTRAIVDPMSYLSLIHSIETTRALVPNCTIGIHAGGRNWLPVTVMAILLGVDLVRVGIEDQFWACPHKDEYLKGPVESVEKIVQIAKALGRDIATPDDTRKILGIKVTSR
jgi:3-keto-5-aminohexanoate cleavage enzyme